MLNEKFHKELKKGLPSSLYFLWSKESFFLEEALTKVAEVVVAPQQRDFNYDIFYPSANPHEILDIASTFPFLAPRRLVILKDFHEFSTHHIKALTSYFKKSCETTCMLILSQKEPKLGPDVARHVYPLRIRESDIPEWIKQRTANKGIKFSESAVDYLIESVGTDIWLLAMEIEKLALTGLGTIEGKDIIGSTGMMRGYTSFDLIDALIADQKTRAFRILKTLIEGRSSDLSAILGALNWHYTQFYILWVNKGKRPLKMKDATYRMLLKYLPSFTLESFCSIFQSLHEADLGIKTSGRPKLALEILLIKLLQIGTKN